MKSGRIPSIKAKLKTENKKSMPFSFCLFHYLSFLPLSSLMLPISLSLTLSHSRTYNFSLAICLSLKLSILSLFLIHPSHHISTHSFSPQPFLSILNPCLLNFSFLFSLPSVLHFLLKCSFLPPLFILLSTHSIPNKEIRVMSRKSD